MAEMLLPRKRPPVHPGEVLREEFLKPLGLTQRDLAKALGIPYQRINEIVRGKRGVTPSTALRLARFFGTTPQFWLRLQEDWNLYHAYQEEKKVLSRIRPYKKRVGAER